MAKKNRSLMIIGSIVLGLISVLLVYVILISTGTISGREYTLRFEAISREKEYDGTPLTLNDYRLVEGQEYLDLNHHSVIVSFSGNQTDVGESVGSLEVAVFDEHNAEVTSRYNIITTSATLKVTPRTITVRTNPYEKAYDGNTVDVSEMGQDSDWYEWVSGEAVAGQELRYSVSGSQTEIGSSYVTVDLSVYDDQGNPINPDNYRVVYEGEQATITVRPRYIYVTTVDQSNYYNGTAFTVSDATPNAGRSELRAGDVIRSVRAVFSEINAGEYPIDQFEWSVFDASGRDVSNLYTIDPKSSFGTYRIMQVPLTLKTDSAIREYDGTALGGNEDYCHVINWEQKGINDKYELNSFASITNVGKIDNTVAIVIRNTKTGEDVTSNYDITEQFGELEVTKREITIKTYSETKSFDGSPIFGKNVLVDGKNYEISAGSLAAGDTITVELDTKLSDVGTKSNVVNKVLIIDAKRNDVTDNYHINKNEGTLEMIATSITVVTESGTWDYDGKEHKADNFNVTNLPSSCHIEVYDWPTVTNATYDQEKGTLVPVDNKPRYVIYNGDNQVVYDSSKKNNQSNFAVKSETWGTLTVKPIEITVQTGDPNNRTETKSYDGTPIQCHIYKVTGGALREGDSLVMTWPNDYTNVLRDKKNNVLDVDNKPNIQVLDRYGNDITQNYHVTPDWGKLKVTPISLYVKTYDVDKEYDGTPLVVSSDKYEITGLQGTDHIDNVSTYSFKDVKKSNGKTTSVDNVITFVVRNKDNQDVTSNYEIVEEQIGKLTIHPIEIYITTGSTVLTYDGNEHTFEEYTVKDKNGNDLPSTLKCEVSKFAKFTDANEDQNVKYQSNSVGEILVKMVSSDGEFTDVSKDNLNIHTEYGTVVIKKYPVLVTSVSKEKQYDGTPFEYDENEEWFTVKNLDGTDFSFPNGDVEARVSIALLNDSLKNIINCNGAGKTYDVPLQFFIGEKDVTDNFEAVYPAENKKARIQILPITVKIHTGSGYHTYDGQEHTFENNADVLDSNDVSLSTNDNYQFELYDFTKFVNVSDTGKNECKLSLKIKVNGEFQEVDSKNINPITDYGKGEITKLVLKVDTKDYTKVFDNKVVTADSQDDEDWFTVIGCFDADDHEVEVDENVYDVKLDTKKLNATLKDFIDYNKKDGYYSYKVEVVVYEHGTNVKNENFTCEAGEGKFTITQIPVNVTCNKDAHTIPYDGKTHTFEEFNDYEFNFPDGYDDELKAKFTAELYDFKEFKDVSLRPETNEYKIRFKLDEKSVNSDNFDVTEEPNTLIIITRSVINVQSLDQTKTFDNEPFEITEENQGLWFKYDALDLPADVDLVIDYDKLNADISTYVDYTGESKTFDISEYITIYQKGSTTVNNNYDLVNTKTGKLMIEQLAIKIIVKNTESEPGHVLKKYYDGTPLKAVNDKNDIRFNEADAKKLSDIGAVYDIVNATEITDVSYSNVGAVVAVENSVDIIITIDERDVTDNFKITQDTSYLKIDPIEVYLKTKDREFSYDGAGHYDNDVNIKTIKPNSKSLSEYEALFDFDIQIDDYTEFVNCKFDDKGELVGYSNKPSMSLKVTLKANDADVSNNFIYKINESDIGTILIKPQEIYVKTKKYFDEISTKYFDGLDFALPLDYTEYLDVESMGALAAIGDLYFEVSIQNAPIKAGDEGTLVVKVVDGGGDEVQNFNVNIIGNKTLRVLKLEINAISESKTWIYDNGEPNKSWPVLANESEILALLPAGWSIQEPIEFTGLQEGVGKSKNAFLLVLLDSESNEMKDSPYKGCVSINYQYGDLEIIPYITGTGDLTGQSAVPSGETISFHMEVDKEGLIYLRDRSYGDYNGVGWNYIPDYYGDYNANNILAKLLDDNSHANTSTVTISISSDMPYLVPYFATDSDLFDNPNGGDTHIQKAHSTLYPYTYTYYNYEFYLTDDRVLSDVNYIDFESDYREYVYSKYLTIDNSLKQDILDMIKEYEDPEDPLKVKNITGAEEDLIVRIAEFIRSYTYGSNEYRNGQKDIVRFFLNIGGEYEHGGVGICQDFASAATLMYRAYNIPARYVTGFVCYIDDEGTFKPNTEIEVNQTLAHSWVEIYIDGMGWVPVEVTPLTVGGEDVPLNIHATKPASMDSELDGDVSSTPQIPENNDILKVTSSHSGTFYLRGQSFGNYNGHGFGEVGTSYIDEDYNPLTLVGKNYRGYYKTYNMSIKNVGSGFGSRLTPYFTIDDYCKTELTVDVDGDGEYDPLDGDVIKYLDNDTYLSGNYGSKYLTNYVVIPVDYDASSLTGAYATELATYKSYVYANYLYIGTAEYAALVAKLDEIIASNGLDVGTTGEKIQKVQRYLQETGGFSYALSGWSYSGSEDIALSFLTTKKGKCDHFAMAGTLLLRRLGIPARFTKGVMINIDNSEINTEITVRDSSCHAWVEVFLDNFGWVPLEVTASVTEAELAVDTEIDWDNGSDVHEVIIYPHPDYVKYDPEVSEITGNVVVGEFSLGDAGKYEVRGKYKAVTTDFGNNLTAITNYQIFDTETDYEVTNQFNVTLLTGTLMLYREKIIIETEGAKKTYDGTPLEHHVVLNVNDEDVDPSHTFNAGNLVFLNHVDATDTGRNVPNDIDIINSVNLITDGMGNDVTNEYWVVTENTGQLQIRRRNITITAESSYLDYDDFLDYCDDEGTDKYIYHEYAAVSGLATGDYIYSVTFSSDSFLSEEQDVADNVIVSVVIKNALGDDVTSCYNIKKNDGYLELIY